jgi:hypothetical protein
MATGNLTMPMRKSSVPIRPSPPNSRCHAIDLRGKFAAIDGKDLIARNECRCGESAASESGAEDANNEEAEENGEESEFDQPADLSVEKGRLDEARLRRSSS